ncbi:hypothetical protein ABW20_dc0105116 [Dactylellina cionopaga]|nr:hypothetical protein ABW20_dc0105116 [Dactylellina cionopaga]
MILQNKDEAIMWPIYYDVFIPGPCFDALQQQVDLLLGLSEDTQSWSSSDIGKTLRIGSTQTLTILRKIWTYWASILQNKSKEKRLFKDFRRDLHSVNATRTKNVGKNILSVARSAGPLVAEAAQASISHFQHYWDNGVVENSPKQILHPNPTFALSKFGDKFSVHYAIVPFTSEGSPPKEYHQTTGSSDFTRFVDAAKKEFKLWCRSLKVAQQANTCTICFFIDEALELCGSLSQKLLGPSIETTRALEVAHEDALSKGYYFNHPSQFNVINISNLIDHLGLYNLILSVLPLLRKDFTSSLHTETLLTNMFDTSHGEDGLHQILGVDPPSLFSFLGIAPIDYICGQTSLSQAGEFMLNGFGNTNKRQEHGRLIWKHLVPFHTKGTENTNFPSIQKFQFAYDNESMVNFLITIYKKLFEVENHSWMFARLNTDLRSKGVLQDFQHNTRATFSLFLHKVKAATSQTVNWQDLMDKLIPAVSYEAGSMIASCFVQEQDMLNYLYGISTVDYLGEDPVRAARAYSGRSGLDSITSGIYQPATCLTFAIPLKAFQKFLGAEMGEVGTPPFQLALAAGSLLNNFGSLRRRFGKLDPIEPFASPGLNIQNGNPIFQEDLDSWQGKSEVMFSCMVPTWFLLLEGCNVSLNIVSSPMTVQFVQSFGLEMSIFKASVKDHHKVRLSTKFPTTRTTHIVLPNSENLTNQNEKKDLRVDISSSEGEKLINLNNEVDVGTGTTIPLIFIDLKKHKKGTYAWINTVASFAFSEREREQRDATCRQGTLYQGDMLTEMKETIHTILMRHAGTQGHQVSIFTLFDYQTAKDYILLLVKDIRIDLSGNGVFADCALVPLQQKRSMPTSLLGLMAKLHSSGKVAGVKTSTQEKMAWLQHSVDMAESCRTWAHNPEKCEYLKTERIPVSGPEFEVCSPICSCGNGVFPQSFKEDHIIKPFLPYATRIALGPIFSPPYSAKLQNIEEKVNKELEKAGLSHKLGKPGSCAVCNKAESSDGQQLKKCSRCRAREYCSKECQTQDWKMHKAFCKSKENKASA